MAYGMSAPKVRSFLIVFILFAPLQAYMKEYDLLKIEVSEKKKRAFEFFKALVKLRSLQAERVDSSSKKIQMLQQVR